MNACAFSRRQEQLIDSREREPVLVAEGWRVFRPLALAMCCVGTDALTERDLFRSLNILRCLVISQTKKYVHRYLTFLGQRACAAALTCHSPDEDDLKSTRNSRMQ
ncbi:hypothetical protein CDAR_190701 [Caerostris darwini]|uniref:Uncharacterized protein n=1 Tax=Caerostris darwini TaxID=1538125 RepID=A0AAV4NHV6_9ARAC|nr:hypothetical protein CDAR_190701 [Caerostris darwini]